MPKMHQNTFGGRALPEPTGGALALPQWAPNVFWCILGIILHRFDCLNDEGFPVICSPFEGRFHCIDVIAKCGHFL